MFSRHAGDFYSLKFVESMSILKTKKKKKTKKTKNTTLFDSECHVTYFKSRKWIIRQAQAVWLISPIFNVKPNTYLPSFSYLQHPYHSSIKNHNTGYHSDFKLLTNKNLRFLDYQLKSQKNSGLKTNHTESQLFKASRHYFFCNYIQLYRKTEKKNTCCLLLKITPWDQKPEPLQSTWDICL